MVTRQQSDRVKSERDSTLLSTLTTILNRCEEAGVRLGYPGEGGERAFRGWLVTDFLIDTLRWPAAKIVVGEGFDILLQDAEGFPVNTIETKTPYRLHRGVRSFGSR